MLWYLLLRSNHNVICFGFCGCVLFKYIIDVVLIVNCVYCYFHDCNCELLKFMVGVCGVGVVGFINNYVNTNVILVMTLLFSLPCNIVIVCLIIRFSLLLALSLFVVIFIF